MCSVLNFVGVAITCVSEYALLGGGGDKCVKYARGNFSDSTCCKVHPTDMISVYVVVWLVYEIERNLTAAERRRRFTNRLNFFFL